MYFSAGLYLFLKNRSMFSNFTECSLKITSPSCYIRKAVCPSFAKTYMGHLRAVLITSYLASYSHFARDSNQYRKKSITQLYQPPRTLF